MGKMRTVQYLHLAKLNGVHLSSILLGMDEHPAELSILLVLKIKDYRSPSNDGRHGLYIYMK